ncbi:805_t:CDS:2 [Racocetra fulgida]|uniref:805_t:CDS:1 n=1 Tax=Racocetra fulgida TaxID=60492 RepID=A0A9N8VCB0_9GLOM|nr:805_t:CDS:2 [Racocetra fulgida]
MNWSTKTDVQTSIEIINDKIKLTKGTNKNKINVVAYQKYFNFLEKLGLREELQVVTTYDELTLGATLFHPLLINKNNNKIIVFCHGLTNNRWSLFYTMHLALQRGYQVVSYDARNHGLSGKSATTLGQIEACDLQDIITWVKEKYRPEKIGLYASFRLHYQLSKNKLNRNKINLYLCRYADHGEFPFLGDYIPDNLR